MTYYQHPDPAEGVLRRDFTYTYLAARDLHEQVRANPAEVPQKTFSALEAILTNFMHDAQKNAHHLYREAARGLSCLLVRDADPQKAGRALAVLGSMLGEGTRKARLAVASVLGGLPTSVRGPRLENIYRGALPEVELSRLLESCRAQGGAVRREGRSLLFDAGNQVLVVKLARSGERGRGLSREALWMQELAGMDFGARFEIPRPVSPEGAPVFYLRGGPREPGLHERGLAMAYLAHPDYFAYPNDHRPGRLLPEERFVEVMERSALLFGELAGRGILHDSPIPLFHNRTTGHRRVDAGVYEWHRMGRLDRWLHSCRYPNFGCSGVRDFEHLHAYRGEGMDLYRAVGSTFLSLALVAGSYFRAKAPGLVGFAAPETPVDARHLFDPQLLERVLERIYAGFYRGFTGAREPSKTPFDLPRLAQRMVQEMGVDQYMYENLRIEDQENMDDARFTAFVTARGLSAERAAGLRRGEADVPLPTGPHLGRFNNLISLPEIIEFSAAAAARCLAGRYLRDHVPEMAAGF